MRGSDPEKSLDPIVHISTYIQSAEYVIAFISHKKKGIFPQTIKKNFSQKEGVCFLKGLLHENCLLWFFLYQTVPRGPSIDVLEPFPYLANFHRVIALLKRFSSASGT